MSSAFPSRQCTTEGWKTFGRSYATTINPQGRGNLQKLRVLAENNPDKRFDGIIHYISDLNTLITAYEMIKSKTGNMTKGTSEETLDGISFKFL